MIKDEAQISLGRLGKQNQSTKKRDVRSNGGRLKAPCDLEK